MDSTWLVVGLGNPGRRYERTRHNAGARAVQRLADQLGTKLKRAKPPALIGETKRDGKRIVLARLPGFMNESGRPLAQVMKWFDIPPDRLIVVYDEIDLNPGILRLKKGGGSAGHNGLESVVSALGTSDFYRVRIGVGRPSGSSSNTSIRRGRSNDAAAWVLKKIGRREAEEMAVNEALAGDAALAIIDDGLERAMNKFNTR